MMKRICLVAAAGLALGMLAAASAFAQTPSAQNSWSYTCGKGEGAASLTAASAYAEGQAASFGFDLGTASIVRVAKGACSSDKPFFFSQAVPEGNYQVELVLGGGAAAVTTVKAEARRLMLDAVATKAGKTDTRVFIVNVRVPQIGGAESGKRVRLKPREIGNLDWDDKLTLEFNGTNPSVRSISIKRVEDVPTVYLAGDSTMVDQDKEPWASWGQMLPRFFNTTPGGPMVAIANNAESGETIKSFQGEGRFAKIFSTIKGGDYLFMQFAHNDQKQGAGFVPIPEYKALMTKYVEDAKKIGAHPVLVTAMNRREFDEQGKIKMTLGDYPQATRDVAKAEDVPLIDLNAMSKILFEKLGPEGTLKAFVHYPANTFPGQTQALADNTHFNSYGAYELARSVVEGIKKDDIPLKRYLAKDAGVFDPAQPDDPATWSIPASPMVSTATPYGR